MKLTASIIAAGSEMLGPIRVDTNSLKITSILEDFAVPLVRKSVVGDVLSDLVDEIRFAAAHSDVIVTSGGLGPTEDDLTREALAEAFGLEMEVEQAIIDRLEKRFASRGWKMPESNKRQANVFKGQTVLTNERGTAPGHHIETAGKHVWVFPGVPHELDWMLATYFRPWLESLRGGRARQRRVLKVAGMGESAVDEQLKPYYAAHPGELLTMLATGGQVEIHLVVDGSGDDAKEEIARREREVLDLFGDRVFGFDDDTLESVIGEMLRTRGQTLAVAESCTGGLLGSRITDIPGSSSYFLGGGLCYTAAAKTDLAFVDAALIRENGEVSEPVAIAMAQGIRARFGATYGVGITGIAGPTGGTPEKPVGTVHIAVASADGYEHRKVLWLGPRTIIKWFSTQSALDLLRKFVMRSA